MRNLRPISSAFIMGLRLSSLAAKFSLSVFIAKYMSLESLGAYGLISGLAAVFPDALSLGVSNNLSRNAVTEHKHEIARQVVIYAKLIILIYTVLLLTAEIASFYIEIKMPIVIMMVILITEHFNNDAFLMLNSVGRPVSANVSFLIRSGIWIGTYIACAFFFVELRQIYYLLYFWAFGGVAAVIFFLVKCHDWPWAVNINASPTVAWLKENVKRSIILYVNDVMNTSSQYIDRYMVSILLGIEFAGVYYLFWSISNALCNLVRTGSVSIYRPKLIASYPSEMDEFYVKLSSMMKYSVLMAASMAIVAAIILNMSVSYLNKPLIYENMDVYYVILFSSVLRIIYEVLGACFYAQRKDALTLGTGAVVFVCAFVVPLLLIPPFGLRGAGWAIIVALVGGISVRAAYVYRIASGWR